MILLGRNLLFPLLTKKMKVGCFVLEQYCPALCMLRCSIFVLTVKNACNIRLESPLYWHSITSYNKNHKGWYISFIFPYCVEILYLWQISWRLSLKLRFRQLSSNLKFVLCLVRLTWETIKKTCRYSRVEKIINVGDTYR